MFEERRGVFSHHLEERAEKRILRNDGLLVGSFGKIRGFKKKGEGDGFFLLDLLPVFPVLADR